MTSSQPVKMRNMTSRMKLVLVTMMVMYVREAVAFPGDLRLVNNGYDGLTVAISENVPHDHCNHVIHGLKSVLTEFSNVLWTTTGGRASLREVTVALPRSWKMDALTCSLLSPLTTSATPNQAHIRVTSPHPVFGNRPWTQQSQGCGRQGDYIQMGGDFLRATTNDSYVYAARLLVAEWVKFRWGVFEERGYKNDPLYPTTFRDPKTNSPRPNRCSTHSITPAPFCSTAAHTPEAPTKHNAQCGGRAAWDIILQSQDFIEGRNEPSNATAPLLPSFKFVQETAPRIVLLVEDTAAMNLQRRWEFVRKAVRRVVVYDVPDGAYVSLVVFNSVAQTAAPLLKMDSLSDVRQRVGSSLPRNPSRVPESHKCVLCALQEALRAFSSDPAGAEGATIILVTTGKGAAPQSDLNEMSRLANSRGVRIDTVLYPMTERRGGPSASHGLETLVADTRGSSFTVMDEGVGNDSKVSMMVALMDALLAAVRRSAPPAAPGAPVIIHSRPYPGGIASMASGTFTLDESLGPSARFSIYYYDLNHVGNTVKLTTPSGQTIASVNMQEEDGDANVIFVNIPKAERGLWHYQVENRADSHQGLHIQVTGTESEERKISLRLWTSLPNTPINATDPSVPVIIYAEVKDDEVPILNAKVTAKLQRLGTNATGSNYDPIYVDLYDNGFGDPDITGGDGVYSRYLPALQGGPGHYELSVNVDHNSGLALAPINDAFTRPLRIYSDKEKQTCCGSVIRYDHVKPVAQFQRSTTYGVLDVVSRRPPVDLVPPTRILDLRTFVNLTTREVSLRWTAPGDDYDWDRAHHYEAKLASSWAEAKAFEGQRISGMPAPVMVGTEQAVSIQVDTYDQLVYVVIRAVDEAGNRGGVSNIAALWVPQPPTTPPIVTSPRTLAPSSDPSEPLGRGITQPVRVAGLNLEDMAVIIGSVGGFLIIVAVLATFCYCHVARRRRHQHKKDTEKIEANRNVIIKTNSTLMVDQDESQDSVDSAVKEEVVTTKDGRPLSPMQSWGASKLLQEHERRFSVTSGPLVEAAGTLAHYQSLQEQFPDVTLTGTHSYPSSQTPSTTHSDPPAYQPPYTTVDAYAAYPYPYHPGYSHEELPPYTPGLSSQSSQASTAYTHEMASQPSELAYPVDASAFQPADMPSFVGEIAYTQAQPPMYATYPEDAPVTTQAPVRAKVPPPVAPKPPLAARAAAVTTATASVEPKRRNVTQV
ncbi:calcium-activated chloride channel regulator 1-like [Penaeus chinensis]|uniref:calcium-activated chloride channel regulator 1-like n=1 Tax=Penaeus chinensis TaxID=139456 RepID=UPI001FB7A86F|nr:calcium-activated chloride channel regulator 1-like [Penaeus chinensis]